MPTRLILLTALALLLSAAPASATIVPGSIRTKGHAERTQEGVGKGTTRKLLRAKLKGEKCRTFKHPTRISIFWLGSMTPVTGRPHSVSW